MNMVEISRHRDTTHPRWRMLFAVVVLLSGLVRHCEPMSVKRLTDASTPPPSSSSSSSSSSSASATLSRNSAESRSHNLGSPSDLAWQAWLLLDSQTGTQSGLDSASFLRRITPKSVFIAPALPALPPCADGYRADTMGRCVKNVDIDHEAHLGFLLQRLNNRYSNRGGIAHPEAQTSNNNQKKSSGPFQLNIPLLSNPDHSSSQQDHEETEDSIVIPIVVPARRDAIAKEEEKPPAHPLLITLYGTTNNSKSEKTGESNLFSANASLVSATNKSDQIVPSKVDTVVVPVAEFVEDANDTNFSGVVDYKIPIDLRTILNISNIRTLNTSDEQDTWRNGSQFSNSTEASPMLILLSSMPPNFIVPNDSQTNGTHDPSGARVSNLTRNTTDKESIGDDVPEAGYPSKDLDVPPTVVEKTESIGTTTRESQETESFYDEEGEEEMEDYVDSTDLPEEEESSETEGGEILKHGEAGMAIPLKDIERLQLDKEERRRTKNETLKIDRLDEILIRFNDSASLEKEEKKDESASNVSSEVSIKGDIILETTLLDVTTDKARNLTEASQPNKNRHEEENSDEDLRELFEAHDDSVSTGTEPEVLLAPGPNGEASPSSGQRGETSTASRNEDQEELDAKSEELVASPSSSETLLYDPGTRDRYTEEDPIDVIHTIDEEAANSKAPAFFPKKSKGSDLFHAFEPGTLNFRPTLDYDRQPQRQPVRFPSEEVNSIHGQNYKEGIPYPLDDGLHSSTKSSVFGHQKPFHRGVSLWRPFARQQPQQQQTGEQDEGTINSQRQRLSPLSVSFWTAMPLMRDPGLYSTGQDKGANGGQRRAYASNRFPSVSPS